MALALPLGAEAAFVAGLGLLIYWPFSPGLWAVLAGLALWAAPAFLMGGLPSPVLGVGLAWAVAGLTSSWWTARLGLTYTMLGRDLALGMLIGGMAIPTLLGPLLLSAGLPPLAFGFVGAWVGGSLASWRSGRPAQAAMKQGLAALVSSLGPRGLQLVAALLAIDTALGTSPLGGGGGIHVAAP